MPPIFNVSPEKQTALSRKMEALGIHEKDLIERFIKGSGSGGQKVNKTSSCVYLMHTPTGIEVKCQRDRSQTMNRFLARRELCDVLDERLRGEKSAREQAREKIRRQKRRRSRRQKDVMLNEKKKQGAKKSLRSRVHTDE
jgi:protein subunit release factor B